MTDPTGTGTGTGIGTEWLGPVDLDNCAAEPIHVPGAIQGHGVLVAVTEPDLRVEVVSANLAEWCGVAPADALGRPLAEVLGADAAARIDEARRRDWVERLDEVPVALVHGPGMASISRSDDHLLIEVEDDAGAGAVAGHQLRDAAMAMQRCATPVAVAEQAARWVRSLTGFDRVMVYRFDAEWNGEVIAEERRGDLNPFLGLHYPATDIPAQARELYRRNWIRTIPDIGYRPVPLLPPVGHDSGRPLDLSRSTLRSVSPIHVEYLSNMGVGASMSVSILMGGELWGLIACHHYAGPLRPDVAARNACEHLGQLISLRVAETVEAQRRARALDLVSVADGVAEVFAGAAESDLDRALVDAEPDVLKLAGAAGAVVVADRGWTSLGLVPPADVVEQLLACWPGEDEVMRTEAIAEVCPAVADHLDTAAGVLGVALGRDRREAVLWFRPELVRTVDWGGDPANAKLYEGEGEGEGDGVRLSPRKSFDRWRSVVRGRAEPWDDAEVGAAARFGRHLAAAMLRREREAAALADDLQRAMLPAELPPIPGYGLDAHHAPAGSGRVGGDWYDALDVGAGRVAVVIGDVAGHGLAAAAEMAQLRNVLRAYLVEDPTPSRALGRLDAFLQQVLPGSIATVACAVLDTSTHELSVASAGHPPAVLVDGDGGRLVPTDGDPLLGVVLRQRHQRHLVLAPGAALVLYSDGVVERRDRPLSEGIVTLASSVEALLADRLGLGVAAAVASGLLGPGEPTDDVTTLVLWRQAATDAEAGS